MSRIIIKLFTLYIINLKNALELFIVKSNYYPGKLVKSSINSLYHTRAVIEVQANFILKKISPNYFLDTLHHSS